MDERWFSAWSIMLEAIAQWSVLSLALMGIGQLVRRLSKLDPVSSPLFSMWLGLGGLLMLSYVVHWFTGLATLPVLIALGLTALSPLIKCFRPQVIKKLINTAISNRIPIALMISAIAWFANKTIGSTENYDSYLYHLSLIDYFADSRLIPGIANLDTRLGLQSSIYNIAAVFQGALWGPQGYRLANGFIVLLLIAESVIRFVQIKSRSPLPSDLIIIFGTPLLLRQITPSAENWITSPSPDTAGAVLLLVAFAYSFDAFQTRNINDYSKALILCSIAITFRPLAIFILIFLTLAFFAVIKNKEVPFTQAIRIAIFSGLFLVSFLIHNWITTGYFVYPTSLSLGNPSWKIPAELMTNDQKWVESWAKAPGLQPSEVLGNWNWFKPWLSANFRSFQPYLEVFIFGLLLNLLQADKNSEKYCKSSLFSIYSLTALIVTGYFWLIRIPDLRFGWAVFIAIATFPLSVAIVRQGESSAFALKASKLFLGVSVVLLIVNCTIGSARPRLPVKHAERGFVEWTPKTQLVTLPNGEKFVTPAETDQCGRVLLCTKLIASDIRPYNVLGRTGYKND